MELSSFYISPDAQCTNVTGASTARIYRQTMVENTYLGDHATIGDFSRVSNSSLAEYAAVQRFNMVYGSHIGRYSFTGRNTAIWYADIGSFCSISWNVSIGGANHDYNRLTTHSFLYDGKDFDILPEGETGYDRFTEPCIIENDVWIAANTCICRGITVGTGAVIAAGAVVTHDVEPYTIVAGVPARPLKKRFSDDVIRRLLACRWWELPADVMREHYALFNAIPTEETLSQLEKLREDREKGLL